MFDFSAMSKTGEQISDAFNRMEAELKNHTVMLERIANALEAQNRLMLPEENSHG